MYADTNILLHDRIRHEQALIPEVDVNSPVSGAKMESTTRENHSLASPPASIPGSPMNIMRM